MDKNINLMSALIAFVALALAGFFALRTVDLEHRMYRMELKEIAMDGAIMRLEQLGEGLARNAEAQASATARLVNTQQMQTEIVSTMMKSTGAWIKKHEQCHITEFMEAK